MEVMTSIFFYDYNLVLIISKLFLTVLVLINYKFALQ